MSRTGRPAARRTATPLVVAMVLLGLLLGGTPAQAAPVGLPVTYDGHSYSSAVQRPSENKPQSKLWYADGAWWALMVSPAGNLVHIYELRADHTWRDTGTVVDTRVNSTGDALWVPADGTLHVVSRDDTSSPRVARFTYAPGSRTWSMDAGFPITIQTSGGSESASIDQDSTGRLWVTYTRLSKLWVAVSDPSGLAWTAGFNPQLPDTKLSSDDISAVIAFDGKIGLLWSDQDSDAFRFAIHEDGAATNQWAVEDALAGANLADDHINLKQLSGDSQGRIFAAIKTSNDAAGAGATLVGVLTRTPRADGTGQWSLAPAGTVADDQTRPIIMIDETNQELYFFATAPVEGGDIFYKKAPLDDLRFPPGRGQPFVNSSKLVNNASGSKQPVTAETGLVILAAAEGARRYVHAEMALAGGPPGNDVIPPSVPTGLSATADTDVIVLAWTASTDNVGVTGYTVRRDDGTVRQATGTGLTDLAVIPGTRYTYTIDASDAAGNRSAASAAASATVPPPAAGQIALRGVSSAANSASSTLTVPVPAASAGDLLLASIDVRGTPTITAPAGWNLIRTDVNGTAMRKATYWRTATAAEPASHTWRFSSQPAALGIMLSYSGVSTSQPVDASSGLTSTTRTVTAPWVQTTVSGTQVVALFGVARASDLTPPGGMQERAEADSPPGLPYPMTAAAADLADPPAGPTGDKSATSAVAGPGVGQLVALRPAG